METTKEKTFDIRVTEREFHTILAGLRFWQEQSEIENGPAYAVRFNEIATQAGAIVPLDDEQINDLCERINTEPIGYDRLVVLAPKGNKRREVRLGDVQIPDMWHLAMALRKLADHAETLDADGLDDLLAAVGHAMNLDAATLRYATEQLLETWYLANDLKMNLAGEV